ncbi:SDR family NAD(P)-dependent oxidoreductase [Streptosporangium sp. NPDC004631]
MREVLAGKVAVVTGGSPGVGRGVVERLVRDGATVVVGFRESASAAEEVVTRAKVAGGSAYAVRADLTSTAEVRHFFDEADELAGRIDILVNNAAVMIRSKFADTTEEDFGAIMTGNVKAPFFAIQQAALRMCEGGRIVNISSTATTPAHPAQAAYSASKAALDQMTRVAVWRYLRGRSLVGEQDQAEKGMREIYATGVDEVACLVDFGVSEAVVVETVGRLMEIRAKLRVQPEQGAR